MDSKARAKPMRNILNRILLLGDFEIVIFGDKVLLDEDPENWPFCDFLIAFFSTGFPLDKAIAYVRHFNPVCINDLSYQQILQDRRLVLTVLQGVGVPTPYSIWANRDYPDCHSDEVVQRVKESLGVDLTPAAFQTEHFEQLDEDTIVIGGKKIRKPFVEKPASGEDHNVYIYYPKSAGGGARKLFRKVGNKSSEFDPTLVNVRTDKSYIYEEFMTADNLEDVKVYTISDIYHHAETRKSPVVDGVVQRNAEGKEVRYITPLSEEERTMATKVSKAFKQTVCGFDLLRAGGKSYVIDVNGWSFVKGNDEYYDRCAKILRDICVESAAARKVPHSLIRQIFGNEGAWRLKAFVSVLRHGDRTPKQKVKFIFRSAPFLRLLKGSEEELILKKPEELAEVSTAIEEAAELEDSASLAQLRFIMEKKGPLPGTKIQIKPSFKKKTRILDKIQLIAKWGGEYTHAGRHQSKDLGENLRKDLVLMNKRVLEDVRVYSSSERRCLATADIFLRYFLSVDSVAEDQIIVSRHMLDDSDAAKEQMELVKAKLVQIVNADGDESSAALKLLPPGFILPTDLVDPSIAVTETIEILKTLRAKMKENMAKGLFQFESRWCCSDSPFLVAERWEKLFEGFCDVERKSFEASKVSELYDSMKFDALHNRDFLEAMFGSPDDPNNDMVRKLWYKSRNLFDFVAPQEYGIEKEEKLEIGVLSALPLVRQIVDDLEEARDSLTPCTRLFFTKESKVITLLNVILLCGIPVRLSYSPQEVDEVDYLTQIVFELYERTRHTSPIVSNAAIASPASSSPNSEANDVISRAGTPQIRPMTPSSGAPREYSIRLSFSPGAHDPSLIDTQIDAKHSISVQPRRWITDHIPLGRYHP
ncbi:histidine phosphatase superfamily-domain-containing protein [Hyaloraphidium curvatum]|nr:histidine phosphatase superfamily-domain-containing protein [Hyaloraphidium curvatum]